jgi:hypothetical protein
MCYLFEFLVFKISYRNASKLKKKKGKEHTVRHNGYALESFYSVKRNTNMPSCSLSENGYNWWNGYNHSKYLPSTFFKNLIDLDVCEKTIIRGLFFTNAAFLKLLFSSYSFAVTGTDCSSSYRTYVRTVCRSILNREGTLRLIYFIHTKYTKYYV